MFGPCCVVTAGVAICSCNNTEHALPCQTFGCALYMASQLSHDQWPEIIVGPGRHISPTLWLPRAILRDIWLRGVASVHSMDDIIASRNGKSLPLDIAQQIRLVNDVDIGDNGFTVIQYTTVACLLSDINVQAALVIRPANGATFVRVHIINGINPTPSPFEDWKNYVSVKNGTLHWDGPSYFKDNLDAGLQLGSQSLIDLRNHHGYLRNMYFINSTVNHILIQHSDYGYHQSLEHITINGPGQYLIPSTRMAKWAPAITFRWDYSVSTQATSRAYINMKNVTIIEWPSQYALLWSDIAFGSLTCDHLNLMCTHGISVTSKYGHMLFNNFTFTGSQAQVPNRLVFAANTTWRGGAIGDLVIDPSEVGSIRYPVLDIGNQYVTNMHMYMIGVKMYGIREAYSTRYETPLVRAYKGSWIWMTHDNTDHYQSTTELARSSLVECSTVRLQYISCDTHGTAIVDGVNNCGTTFYACSDPPEPHDPLKDAPTSIAYIMPAVVALVMLCCVKRRMSTVVEHAHGHGHDGNNHVADHAAVLLDNSDEHKNEVNERPLKDEGKRAPPTPKRNGTKKNKGKAGPVSQPIVEPDNTNDDAIAALHAHSRNNLRVVIRSRVSLWSIVIMDLLALFLMSLTLGSVPVHTHYGEWHMNHLTASWSLIIQWLPTLISIIGCIPVMIMIHGSPYANAIQFVTGIVSTVGSFIACGTVIYHIILYTAEIEAEHELVHFHDWDSFTTAAMFMVLPLWVLPIRVEATIVAYQLIHSTHTIDKQWEPMLSKEPHPHCLHSTHLCLMKFVQVPAFHMCPCVLTCVQQDVHHPIFPP
jgi:hypothetical protein